MQTGRFQPRPAFGACGVIVICAAAALFMGEYRVAAMMAAQAGIALCLSYNAAKTTGRKRTRGIK
jgi:hypothetical protein